VRRQLWKCNIGCHSLFNVVRRVKSWECFTSNSGNPCCL
jgi:hypothetical protein